MKRLALVLVTISLLGCGGGYDDIDAARGGGGGISSTVAKPMPSKPNTPLNKPSDLFCKSVVKKTCKELKDYTQPETMGCVAAQQMYSCGYEFLDGDKDGYLCDVEFQVPCEAPSKDSVNNTWNKQ